MTSSHRVTPGDGTSEEDRDGEHATTPPRDTSRALHWAQMGLCAGGITTATAIWALEGPPLIAAAVATAAAGSAGWQITVNVRR
ncbi:hypothetical protein ACIOKD_41710 [Streptomyces sp. NPDC087844]|uniref:hypothetical protein n=1 Tax=Streptomyces sp. NPDC087844 TaxID=3365805 RepID=UPI00381FFAC9